MGKNNYHLKNIKEGTKVESYSIKKFKVGAASVVIGASIFFGAGAVAQASESVSNNTVTDESLGTEKKLEVAPKAQAKPVVENTRESVSAALASKLENSEKETLNKVALTKLIEEIDGKFTNGKYTSKTEDSVNQLKAALEAAKTVLSTAKSQAELTQAHANLVVATTKLQTKPEEKKEAPAVNTTNGKDTVGKKATNTEKSSESNSITNAGFRDERNGKALDKSNPFRTDTTPSTTDDTSANQTYTAPAADANLEKLSEKLRELPDYIENNEKVQDMDTLGDAKGVTAGSVTEINEFGGWKAVNQEDGSPGKFAIAKKTGKGVFPLETVNVVGSRKIAWVEEQSFNRDKKYMLFLSEVRTQATQSKDSYESKPYQSSQVDAKGQIVSIGVKGYKGIEKRFKVYHSQEETKVNIQFKTGYSGIMEGDGEKSRAKYNVEVFSEVNGLESLVYSTEFDPGVSVDDEKQTVVAAENGKPAKGSLNVTTADAALEELSQDKYKPLGTGGSFTSKGITLPKGASSYKVRISSANDRYLGMDYHSRFAQYALPITGQGFNINQDTKNVAKDLLQRIYNKLIEQKLEDTKWSTPETKAAYEIKLTEINNLLSSEISTTSKYKESAKSLIEKYNSLNNRDTIVAAAKADLEKAVQAEKAAIAADNSLTTEQRKEKEKAVDAAKTAEEAKITEAENADKVAEAKTAGVKAVEGVHTPGDLDTVKAAAKAAVDAALAEKAKAIEANDKLSDAEKQAAKDEAKKAADEAKKAIEAATDQPGVDAKATEGTKAVAAVNPVGKEKAKAEVDAALAEKAKAIEANDKLSDAEKAAAKDEAKKAADEAKKAIEAATDQAGVDAKATEGTKAVAAVNPVGKEKAKAEVDAALAEKEKAIEANDKLSDAEKQAAKAEAKKAADEAKKAIEAATDQTGVDAKATEGTKAVEAVNPVGKEKAKAEVEGELAKKLAELENSTDLTDAEKATTKTRVLDEAKKAIEAIEKATTQEEVEQAIRNFVYHISAVVLEKEEYDLSKLFVNGTVIVKQGEVLTDKDILSKLNLPEGVEVVKVEKPETVVLGKGTAKVTLKLADGTQVTITVPVTVVEGTTAETSTNSSEEETTVNTSDVAKSDATEKSSNNVSKKQLPNTGTTETNTGLAGLGLAMLTGLFAVARRRKNDKN